MLTIITTTRDNTDELSRTLASLIDQDCRYFEWLIYDGSHSTSIDVLHSFADIATNNGISTSVVHALDTSIYSAMQNATKYAKGEWCLFLNCGDMLCHQNTIGYLTNYMSSSFDMIYGGNIFIDVDRSVHYHPGASLEKIMNVLETGDTPYYYHMVCQQSIAYRLSLLASFPLSPVELRLAADHNHFLRTIHSIPNVFFAEKPISIYFGGGASHRYLLNTYSEWMYNNIHFIGEAANISTVCDHYLNMIATQVEV